MESPLTCSYESRVCRFYFLVPPLRGGTASATLRVARLTTGRDRPTVSSPHDGFRPPTLPKRATRSVAGAVPPRSGGTR